MTHFLLVFSALVHDACVEDEDEDATETNLLPIEQNSIQRVWSLWMEPTFRDLRHCICKNQQECDFFRRLLVNSIPATGGMMGTTSGVLLPRISTIMIHRSKASPSLSKIGRPARKRWLSSSSCSGHRMSLMPCSTSLSSKYGPSCPSGNSKVMHTR
mmetsp:Transcript_28051/g.59038  ORF Transcript_28051/g.59038 Transcript_28051/m.59038 type:complete len:157 (+) Transcript_28051:191-661(+)